MVNRSSGQVDGYVAAACFGGAARVADHLVDGEWDSARLVQPRHEIARVVRVLRGRRAGRNDRQAALDAVLDSLIERAGEETAVNTLELAAADRWPDWQPELDTALAELDAAD